MAMRGCNELGIAHPKEEKKRLVVYVEIDRCATDAIQVVTGCQLGKRTMKYLDYGKLAATFLDLHTGNAVRVIAREDARDKAALFPSRGRTKYEIQAEAYKAMRDEELFQIERVKLLIRPEDVPGPPLQRVLCEECGEGINDCREVIVGSRVLCRACAYGRYYETYENSLKEQLSL
jgi:formylmethanofuran dehydrogenase subunit E